MKIYTMNGWIILKIIISKIINIIEFFKWWILKVAHRLHHTYSQLPVAGLNSDRRLCFLNAPDILNKKGCLTIILHC